MTKARFKSVCVRNYSAVSLAGGRCLLEDREDGRTDRQADERGKRKTEREREREGIIRAPEFTP